MNSSKLTDGQVMDYAKGTPAYTDERWLQAATATIDQRGFVAVQQPQLVEEPRTESCVIPTFPGYPIPLVGEPQPWQQPVITTLPYTPQPQQQLITPAVVDKILESVKARRDALESVGADTKQLDWVIETIKNARS